MDELGSRGVRALAAIAALILIFGTGGALASPSRSSVCFISDICKNQGLVTVRRWVSSSVTEHIRCRSCNSESILIINLPVDHESLGKYRQLLYLKGRQRPCQVVSAIRGTSGPYASGSDLIFGDFYQAKLTFFSSRTKVNLALVPHVVGWGLPIIFYADQIIWATGSYGDSYIRMSSTIIYGGSLYKNVGSQLPSGSSDLHVTDNHQTGCNYHQEQSGKCGNPVAISVSKLSQASNVSPRDRETGQVILCGLIWFGIAFLLVIYTILKLT